MTWTPRPQSTRSANISRAFPRSPRQRQSSYTGIEGISEQDAAIADRQGLIADRTRELLGQTDLGIVQKSVTDANSRMTVQRDIITNHVDALEGVDPYEASSRLSALMTQIETAYAMTGRIQHLSILNYLPVT